MAYSIDTTKYIDKMKRFCSSQGVNINLENPITIQDKLAWLNIYDQDELKVKCADKIKLHEYCKEVLGEDICIPLIKVYDNVGEINWDELPQQFVIKCNHGSGMNIIVKDKSKLNIEDAKGKLNRWMKDDFAFRNGFEAHYHDIPHKILVEEYMDDGHSTLFDYKFWCFNGKPRFWTINDSLGHGNIIHYNMKKQRIDLDRKDLPHNIESYEFPKQYNEMVVFSQKLSERFKFVRVDFYEVSDTIYLGEMTFTPGAMAFRYVTEKNDIKVGSFLKLS